MHFCFLARPLSCSFQINVIATDTGTSTQGFSIVNIFLDDINDNAPMWDISTIEGSVQENQQAGVRSSNDPLDSLDHAHVQSCFLYYFSGTAVMTIVAGDVDEGENGRVTYTIVEVPEDPPGSTHCCGHLQSCEIETYSAAFPDLLQLPCLLWTLTRAKSRQQLSLIGRKKTATRWSCP